MHTDWFLGKALNTHTRTQISVLETKAYIFALCLVTSLIFHHEIITALLLYIVDELILYVHYRSSHKPPEIQEHIGNTQQTEH